MAKHDRLKRQPTPPSSRMVTIQVPRPECGVVNGVAKRSNGLCIKTGRQVPEAITDLGR